MDSNGNFRNIGTTTSDANGLFSFTWTPDIAGAYTICANFAGSESYFAASTQASFNAGSSGPTAGPTGGTGTSSIADMYFIPAIASILVVLVIIVVLLVLVLRRR